jgi:EmrB/QacA subfamily drug resistance transporter
MNPIMWIVISVAFSSFIVRMNNYSVNVSLPTIAQAFGIGSSAVSWVVIGYILIITSTLLLFGKLSDRIGLKKVFVLGYAIFVLGSLLCGVAHHLQTLLAFRFIQGLGAAMLLATSYAIISRFLPPDRTGSAFGITSTASALGVATGAPLGGLITGYLSWQWVFLINVPVGLAGIVVAMKKIPHEDVQPAAPDGEKHAFDIIGAVLSFLGLLLLLYGISRGKAAGWLAASTLLCIGAGAGLLLLFVLREKRCDAPLLDLRLFSNRVFALALIASLLAYLLIGGNAFLLPFYLNVVKGLDASSTGMVLLVYSLVYVVLSPYAGRVSDRVNPASLCIAAMLSACICAFTFSRTLYAPGLFSTFIFLVWLGVSYVFFFSPNNNQVMRQAPAGNQGSASGLFTTTTNLATALGVAVFEAVFSYGLPGGTAVTAKAVAAKGAFLAGFSNAYLLGGSLCAAAAFCTFLTLRQRQPAAAATSCSDRAPARTTGCARQPQRTPGCDRNR